jgi:hypothetical protein
METNPYQNYDGVEVVPGKVSSAPVLKGTRVAADLLAECLDKGDTVSESPITTISIRRHHSFQALQGQSQARFHTVKVFFDQNARSTTGQVPNKNFCN